jgi:hypothetical protein
MILNLAERRSPLETSASRLRHSLRFGFSLCVVLGAAAAGLYLTRELRPAPGGPQKSGPAPVRTVSEEPWSPGVTQFRARWPTQVYREPWPESGPVGRLRKGEQATVLRAEDGWLLVDTPFGPGWVDTTSRVWGPRRGATPWVLVLPPSDAPAPASTPAPPRPQEPPAPPRPQEPPAPPTPTPVPEPVLRARDIEARREDSLAIAWAREQISRNGMQQLESQNFRLWTDHADSSRLGLLLGLAEQTRRRFRALFEPHFELEELSGRSEVYLFRSRADYLRFYRLFGTASGEALPSGHYSIDLRAVALSDQSMPGNAAAATLVHEMVHLLLDQSLYRGAAQPSPWIGEGLACVLAYTAGSEEGRIALVESRSDRLGVGGAAQERIRSLQEDLRRGTALRLGTLLEAQPAAFVGPAGVRFYNLTWLLCHYLLYAEEGRHRPLLVAAIVGDRAGEIPEATLERIRELEGRFRRWASRLRLR